MRHKEKEKTAQWSVPDFNLLPSTKENEIIRYGRDLIINTSTYLGPKGIVAAISNGMNCQNCHLDAGTRLDANPFALVASSYPKYRDRSGRIESIEFRVNECMQRSMNGKTIDSLSKEMIAIVTYLKWVGHTVPKETPPLPGTAFKALPFLNRAADTVQGKMIYQMKCISCHGRNGEGLVKGDSSGFYYPPLWGDHSYNVSAGMYRISKLAAFVKNNMPFKQNASEVVSELTNEEAWDVSAYILSKHRPVIFFDYDWPKLSTKPVDHPFGPYVDAFSEQQHKYGPFKEMAKKK
ncbi:MAG: c-type cytochrome [Bacteroidota bacterium]